MALLVLGDLQEVEWDPFPMRLQVLFKNMTVKSKPMQRSSRYW